MRVQIKKFEPLDYLNLSDRYRALIDRLELICSEVGHVIPPGSRRAVRFTCMACKGMFDLPLLPLSRPRVRDEDLPIVIKSR